jgi:hypothetical protein
MTRAREVINDSATKIAVYSRAPMAAATAKAIASAGSSCPMRPATRVAGTTRIVTTTQATRSLTIRIRQRGTGRARR